MDTSNDKNGEIAYEINWICIRERNLTRESESLLMTIQNATRTKYVRVRN